MPKWDKYVETDDTLPSFEKFDKTLKTGRRILKKSDDELMEEKRQKEKERDEKRASKRGDEV